MKTLNTMKKFISITTLVLVFVLIAQVALLFFPFFEDRVPKKTFQNQNPQPTDYSMFDYAFMKTEEMDYFFKTEVKEVYGDKEYTPNNYVMGIVFMCVLGVAGVITNLRKKNTVLNQIVSVLWAVLSIDACFGPIMFIGNTVQWVWIGCVVTSFLGAALVAARLFPWVATRYLRKKFLAKDKVAAEA